MAFLFGPPKPVTRYLGEDNKRLPEGLQGAFAGRDDEDIVRKAKIMTKNTMLVSAIASVFDITLWSPQFGIGALGALKRVGVWSIPIVGGGLAYVFAVHTAANLRKVDGFSNHIIGAFAASSVVGARLKTFHGGVAIGMILAGFGIAFKGASMDGIELFSALGNYKHGNVFSPRCDFTLTQNYPGYWVKSESEISKFKGKDMVNTL